MFSWGGWDREIRIYKDTCPLDHRMQPNTADIKKNYSNNNSSIYPIDCSLSPVHYKDSTSLTSFMPTIAHAPSAESTAGHHETKKVFYFRPSPQIRENDEGTRYVSLPMFTPPSFIYLFYLVHCCRVQLPALHQCTCTPIYSIFLSEIEASSSWRDHTFVVV